MLKSDPILRSAFLIIFFQEKKRIEKKQFLQVLFVIGFSKKHNFQIM